MVADGSRAPAAPARRVFLRGAAGAVAGLAVAGTAGARAATVNYQGNWAWCSLCYQAFYAGSGFRGQGDCPKQPGDGHANPGGGVSYNYSMAYNAGAGFQSGWRHCQYCQALYYPGLNPAGACVAEKGGNGSHSPGPSFNYGVPVGLAGPSYQPGWCACSACGAYYHSRGGWGTADGYCWANSQTIGRGTSQHTPVSSWHYELLH
jgi:hypothetical protein